MTKNLWENGRMSGKGSVNASTAAQPEAEKFLMEIEKRERGGTSLLFLVHTPRPIACSSSLAPVEASEQHIQPPKIHPGSLSVFFMFAVLQKWSLIHPPTVSVCFFIEPRSAACTLPCNPFLPPRPCLSSSPLRTPSSDIQLYLQPHVSYPSIFSACIQLSLLLLQLYLISSVTLLR